MSYARFSNDSDVYVFAHIGGFVQCCGCILGDDWDFHSPADIVEHLRQHVAAGHDVPDYLLDEGLYPPEDFIAMCSVFMCREDDGHDGPHTPTTIERFAQIRARTLAPEPDGSGS